MQKKPIYSGIINLITDTAGIKSSDFLPERNRNSKVLAEPHRIWTFSRKPSLFCYSLFNCQVNLT